MVITYTTLRVDANKTRIQDWKLPGLDQFAQDGGKDIAPYGIFRIT